MAAVNDDLISRQAAYEVLSEYYHHKTEMQNIALREALGRVPSAQPERKKGRWVKDGEAYALYKCSACNNLCTVAGWANCVPEEQMYKGFKFCPNCGAEMENSDEQIR